RHAGLRPSPFGYGGQGGAATFRRFALVLSLSFRRMWKPIAPASAGAMILMPRGLAGMTVGVRCSRPCGRYGFARNRRMSPIVIPAHVAAARPGINCGVKRRHSRLWLAEP